MFSSQSYMQLALVQANIAYGKNEVPIGAVVIDENGNIISEAHNLTETEKDISAHAEILAIKKASQRIDNKFLNNCTIYITLEPCPMCAQAISNAKIKTVIYGAADIKSGGIENGAKIFNSSSCHHKPEVISGIMESDCSQIIKDFFKKRR